MNRRRLLAAALASSVAGCADRRPATRASTTPGGPDSGATPAAGGGASVPAGAVGYTFTRADGNRVVDAPAALPATEPVDVPLDEPPSWVAGVPLDAGSASASASASLWVAVGERTVAGVRLVDGESARVDVATAGVPAGAPPALAPAPPRLLALPDGAPLSHPTLVPNAPGGPALVGVDGRGGLLVADDAGLRRLAVDALPDARVVTDGRRAAVLSGATGSYGHGVLGDGVEATRVTLVTPRGDGSADGEADAAAGERDVVTHRRPPGGVIEGLAPTLVDGDPHVTVSDADVGARLAVLTAEGAVEGSPVGRGYRWRHRLAVAPFGPGGEREVAAVRTPHLGGVAEFHRLVDGEPDGGARLERAATRRGYSTHALGSRNLDAALAGDLDGDGATELLVPVEGADALAGLRRVPDDGAGDGHGAGVAEAWRLPLPAAATANLAGVEAGGRATVGVGLADRLRLWPP